MAVDFSESLTWWLICKSPRQGDIRFPNLFGQGIPFARDLSPWLCFMDTNWVIQVSIDKVYIGFCAYPHPSQVFLTFLCWKGNWSMQPVTFSPSDICSFIFQSKEIGLQMHEELLKVTNELYTVSPVQALLLGFGSGPLSSALGAKGSLTRVMGWAWAFLLCLGLSDRGSSWWDVMVYNPGFWFCIDSVGPWACLVCIRSQKTCMTCQVWECVSFQRRRHKVREGTAWIKPPEAAMWVWSQMQWAEAEVCFFLMIEI